MSSMSTCTGAEPTFPYIHPLLQSIADDQLCSAKYTMTVLDSTTNNANCIALSGDVPCKFVAEIVFHAGIQSST